MVCANAAVDVRVILQTGVSRVSMCSFPIYPLWYCKEREITMPGSETSHAHVILFTKMWEEDTATDFGTPVYKQSTTQ